MKRYSLFLFVLLSCLPEQVSLGQSSWLDSTRGALPRINVPTGLQNGGFNLPQVQTGLPSTSLFGGNATNFNPGFGTGPSLIQNRKDRKLGVLIQNTDIGAIVTQVSPGSAGQQAGLVPQDVIVAVSGTRIGNFDNRIVELADELRRSTDSMGRVSLLVLDSRQRVLRSAVVSMSSTSSSIVGSVLTRDRIQLPYGSILSVYLKNVSQPYYEISGGQSVTQIDGMGPYNFELNYDPRYIDANNQYQLTAIISNGNQELYRLPIPIAMNANNFGQPIALTLERSQVQLVGTSGVGQGFPGGNGGVVAGYPGRVDPNMMNSLFMQLLGRSPSNAEANAWQGYLEQGHSIDELKVKLLSNFQFRQRFPDDSAYIRQLSLSLSSRVLNQQELSYWVGRLQSSGSPETVINEMLSRR